VSKEIKKVYPSANITGNKEQPRSGAFEIEVNGKLIFSKFKSSSFPTKEDINSWSI